MNDNTAPFYWVDAFTDQAFGGNPAAVCILTEAMDQELCQKLAFEFGLSETAFVWPKDEEWNLRWFTPVKEVRLCGHATLATATALWAHFQTSHDLRFHTLSGVLTAVKRDELIELEFPARPPKECPLPEGLLASTGLEAEHIVFCGRSEDDHLVCLDSEERVRQLQPNMEQLSEVPSRGTIFTAQSSREECDVASRFFAPRFGVDEDPVTGSAHCCLAAFWCPRLGRSELKAEQLSHRGGKLDIELRRDRVALRGQSIVLVEGRVRLKL